MYERHSEPLLPMAHFLRRVSRHTLTCVGIILGSLLIGTLGYHWLEHLPWLDAMLNAAMILTGMGPAAALSSPAAKIFATLYALYSSLIFVAVTAVLLAPFAHRLLHSLNATQD
jgi:hypothetical protein